MKQLRKFQLNDIPNDFKDSKKRYLAFGAPLSELSFPSSLEEGRHKLDIPTEFLTLDKILIVEACPFHNNDEAAYAIFVVKPNQGEITVLPQKWFIAKNTDLGYQWITRVARLPNSNKLIGDGIRVDPFELTDDGCHLLRLVHRKQA